MRRSGCWKARRWRPGAALAAAATPACPAGRAAALLAAAAGAAAFGGYDDLAGSGDRRGFRGHLGALAHGELTTGAAKLGGIGATGLAPAPCSAGGPVDALLNAGLIAGGANLVNLFDLRPGRAIKVARGRRRRCWPAAGPASAPLAAVRPVPRSRCSREDLGERAMLGDAGRTRSAPCSARPRRRACPGRPGSRCWPGSSA